jgi:hypothetical protein
VRRDEFVDVGADDGLGVGQQHEMVADALQVGQRWLDSMTVTPPSATAPERVARELAARERIKRGDRLVEQQDPRAFAERERQRDLGAHATRRAIRWAVRAECAGS